MTRNTPILLISFALLIAGCSQQQPVNTSAPPSGQSAPTVAPDLQWFQDAKLGMFIHWGPVSQVGTEIGWSRGSKAKKGVIPTDLYDNLYHYFNPIEFDADAFVAAAKAMGARYLVFTTKHHDGFCMFDSAWTDYKITRTPFKRDITREIADACHRANMKLGFYHSPPDWHHPDFRTGNHARYVQYLHRQVRELCTKYGKVDIFWFDGLGGTADDWNAVPLLEMIRTLQPGIVINNRAGLSADYDTPEQRVGKYQVDRPWESCITIGKQWSYKPHDEIKSTAELVKITAQCVTGGGNLLLNVGPKWNGVIEPEQVKRLASLGEWVSRHAEAIYGTRGGPIANVPWGGSTHRGKIVYLFVWDAKTTSIPLPKLPHRIVTCRSLSGGKAEAITEGGLTQIALEGVTLDPAGVIALELDGPAGEPVR